MDDLFDEALQGFQESLRNARKRLNTGKNKAAAKSIQAAERYIATMESEAGHSSGIEGRRMQDNVKRCKQSLKSLKQEYQQISAGAASPSRRQQALFGDGTERGGGQSFNAMSESNRQRARILENSQTQQKTSDVLDDSRRIAYDIRDIGVAAVDTLDDQTAMLVEANQRLTDTQNEATRADRILNSMWGRMIRNKLFLWCIILLLIAANVLVLILAHSNGKSSPSPAPAPPPAPTPSASASRLDTVAGPTKLGLNAVSVDTSSASALSATGTAGAGTVRSQKIDMLAAASAKHEMAVPVVARHAKFIGSVTGIRGQRVRKR